MPRKRTTKGVYRPRSVGKTVDIVGVGMPAGLLALIDRMVLEGLGNSRQDVILRAIAAFACNLDRYRNSHVEAPDDVKERLAVIVDDV